MKIDGVDVATRNIAISKEHAPWYCDMCGHSYIAIVIIWAQNYIVWTYLLAIAISIVILAFYIPDRFCTM